MGIFGWSMPAGCNSTPFDEEGASDLKMPGLPANFSVFWTEEGVLLLQEFRGETSPMLGLGELEWDDEKDDEQNFEAARAVALEALAPYQATLAAGKSPFDT